MALASSIALSRAFARQTGSKIDILARQEGERERAAELERVIAAQKRATTTERQLGQGKLLGTLLGGSTLGSLGQAFQTRDTAKQKLGTVDVGRFDVAEGRIREKEFGEFDKAFGEDLKGAIFANMINDLLTALGIAGGFGGGSTLSDIDSRGLSSIFDSLGGSNV